jgi:charged multivesicular body protein 1
MSKALHAQLFNLKFTSKTLQRNHKKSLKEEKVQKKKLKKAIEQGNMDGARIYAQGAIREKGQAINYLRLSARIDAVASRVHTAVDMSGVTKSMCGVVKGMDKVLSGMNVEKISKAMDKFEKQFEDLDVRSAYMNEAMSSTTASATPEDEVDNLIRMVADEHSLDVGVGMDELGAPATGVPQAAQAAAPEGKEDDLAARLAALHKG